jgi:hypothetical protein
MMYAAILMLTMAGAAQAQPISDVAFDRLYGKQMEYCLTGSLTGASKQEVSAILRRTIPLCHKYSRQIDRIRRRCELHLPENSYACAQLIQFHIVRQYPPIDPRKTE